MARCVGDKVQHTTASCALITLLKNHLKELLAMANWLTGNQINAVQEMKPQSANSPRVRSSPLLKRNKLRPVWSRRVGHGPGTINIAVPWPVPIVGGLVFIFSLSIHTLCKVLGGESTSVTDIIHKHFTPSIINKMWHSTLYVSCT